MATQPEDQDFEYELVELYTKLQIAVTSMREVVRVHKRLTSYQCAKILQEALDQILIHKEH